MFNVDDRKIRAVDASLEILAQGIGNAVAASFPGRSVDEIISQSPGLKEYQREFFRSAASDPSTMLGVAIDHVDRLGIDLDELHALRKFRNAVVHKRGSARAKTAALDEPRVQVELARAAALLERLGQAALGAQVKRLLLYYLDGAPETWREPTESQLDGASTRARRTPPRRKTRKRQRVVLSAGGLSPDQAAAIDAIERWWRGGGQRFVVAGPAGTGKTRLIVEILARLRLASDAVALVGPTNRACDVLRSKLPERLGYRASVSTFHKLLYRYEYPAQWDGEDLKFSILGPKPRRHGVKIVICDESSMLCDLDVEALESNYRVVYLGDAAQLPAITANREMDGRMAVASDVLLRPDVELNTVHRQSGDSSILEAADIVRGGSFLEPAAWDDDATQVLHEDEGHVDRASFDRLLVDADAVLVARNSTRVRLNQTIRELRGFARHPGDWLPKPGELLVSTERVGADDFPGRPEVPNGQQLVVIRVIRLAETTKKSTGEPVEYAEIEAHFRDDPSRSGRWPMSKEMLVGKHVVGDEVVTKHVAGPRSGVLRCDWGYAITVHKAQGSEWPRVLVVDHGGYDKVGSRQWNYVALTRARSTVTIVRLRTDSSLLL